MNTATETLSLSSETRARKIFDAYGGTDYSWDGLNCREWYIKAVDLVDTHGVTGCCVGERFFRALRHANPNKAAGMGAWTGIGGESRGFWQKIVSANI